MSKYYLKWGDEIIGYIDSLTNEVDIIKPNLNKAVSEIFQGKSKLSSIEWRSFLEDRIVSSSRRDIEKILFRCGLSSYNPFKIAKITRAINVKDRCWIAFTESEKYSDCVENILNDVLVSNLNIEGDIVQSPSGQHIKHYGVLNGRYGIFKERLNPISTDVESEVAVYLLAKEMGIPCCPAIQVDDKTVFSEFLYDFNNESIIHFRNLFPDGSRGEDEVKNILRVRPQYSKELFQMLVLDFITNQCDRHLSNFAVKIGNSGESFYPLYDNGDSLFFADSEALVILKCENPVLYSETFGPVGTQWDLINDMVNGDKSLLSCVNLDISDDTIEDILKEAKFSGYRLNGAKIWIRKSMDLVKGLKG